MQHIKAGEGQTLIDIAMQYCGDAMRLFEIAELNNLDITDDLTGGQTLIVPDEEIDKNKIVIEFSKFDLVPSSKDDEADIIVRLEGIDYWAIEDDFVVQ